jgi:hypothetical protein
VMTATEIPDAIDGHIARLAACARAVAISPESGVPRLIGAVVLMGLADALPLVWRVSVVFACWLLFIVAVEALPWKTAGDYTQVASALVLMFYMVVAVIRDTLGLRRSGGWF